VVSSTSMKVHSITEKAIIQGLTCLVFTGDSAETTLLPGYQSPV